MDQSISSSRVVRCGFVFIFIQILIEGSENKPYRPAQMPYSAASDLGLNLSHKKAAMLI